jgi:PKD repeat protein
MKSRTLFSLVISLLILETGFVMAQTTAYILPGQSASFTKRMGSSSVSAYPYYDLNDSFPASISVRHEERFVENYSTYARFSISVASSVPRGTQFNGTITYQFFDGSQVLQKTVNLDFTIIASAQPPDMPPTFRDVAFSPATGQKGDTFHFSVVYQDANGDAPQTVYLQIWDKSYLRGLEMTRGTGSYLTGMSYSCDVKILYQEEGTIRFHIESTDFHGNTFRHPTSGELNGPYIGTGTIKADFSSNVKTGNAPLAVQFTDLSTGTVTTWEWTFGDGSTSTSQNPGHTYTAAGAYTVKLKVTGPAGNYTKSVANYITVKELKAEFTGAPTSGTAPLTVNFTNSSTGHYSYIKWDFGDGTTSSSSNPSHIYNSSGVYTVKLTVGETGSTAKSNTKTRTNYITVNSVKETISKPNLAGSPNKGKVGQTLTFTTGGATSNLGHTVEYQFEWGDGTYSNWGTSPQSHTFSSTGTQYVRARARCKTHTRVESSWSTAIAFQVTYCTLTISVSPSNSGNVTKNPNKVNFSYNETVQVTANTNSGYRFDHWSGSVTGTTSSKSLAMNGDKTVTAYFIKSSAVEANPEQTGIADHFILEQNYPNPFNAETTIRLNVPEASKVIVEIYNLSGECVDRPLNGNLAAGMHTIKWNASNFPSGTYLIRMLANENTLTKKCILLK